MVYKRVIRAVFFIILCVVVTVGSGFVSGQTPATGDLNGSYAAGPAPISRGTAHRFPGSVPGPGGSKSGAPIIPNAVSAPVELWNNYGYTSTQDSSPKWIDATTGVDTGLSQAKCCDTAVSAAIDLGFSFNFFGHTYTQFFISAAGVVGFDQKSLSGNTTSYIPSPEVPNNFIAPYLTQLYVNAPGYPGKVFYQTAGAAPNRTMTVEWSQAKTGNGFSDTFETVLFENGNIDFNYGQGGVSGCGVIGIENADGTDGMTLVDTGNCLGSGLYAAAFHIIHPAKYARMALSTARMGKFTAPGVTTPFTITVTNTGDLGADTYSLSANSTWPVTYFASDGVTSLQDTNGDGKPEIGPVGMGDAVTFQVKFATPADATAGAFDYASLTINSKVDFIASGNVLLISTVPASFIEVYSDYSQPAPRLLLANPAGQFSQPFYSSPYFGRDPVVAEVPGKGLVSLWTLARCLDENCDYYATDIFFTARDYFGNVTVPPRRVTNNTQSTIMVADYDLRLAVTPDGHVGVMSYHYTYDPSQAYSDTFNISFIILDTDGKTTFGPAAVTSYTSKDPYFAIEPALAATGDSHFVLAWNQLTYKNGWYADVDLAILGSNGTLIKPTAKFIPDDTNNHVTLWDYYPNLATLTNQRVLLTYKLEKDDGLYGTVLDSQGGTVKSGFAIADGQSSGEYQVAVQLSDQKIAVAWYTNIPDHIYFAFLDPLYNLAYPPMRLDSAFSLNGFQDLSVCADNAGDAILTYADVNLMPMNLYYALIHSNGQVITPAVISRTAEVESISGLYGIFTTAYNGCASYTWNPPATLDGALQTVPWVGAPSGGDASIATTISNDGGQIATGMTLTATLDPGLTYLSNSLGIPPTINGSQYTFSLPNLALFGQMDFAIQVQTPAGPVGTQYPVILTLGVNGTDANPADNTATTSVMTAVQVYLAEVSN